MNKALEVALVLTAVDQMSGVINSAFAKANTHLDGINRAGTKMAITGGAMTAFFGATVDAAEENEVSVKRLQQVYKSMGETTNQALLANQKYADQLAAQIGIEDEEILAVQAKLATFKSVSDAVARTTGIMDRATQAAFDMASTGFGEASGNAVQLGKALQDPIRGIVALRKSGITFSEAERLKIKTLVESNQKLKAQELIMKAVEKQVGGVAKATATEASKMKVSWSEVVETVGKVLLPAVNSVMKDIQKHLPAIQAWVENNKSLIKVVAGVGVGLLALGTTLKIVTMGVSTVMSVVNGLSVVFNFLAANPIVLIIAGIAAAIFLIVKYWDPIVKWIKSVWQSIKDFFVNLWAGIKNMFWKVVSWVKEWGILFIGPVGFIIKFWPQIVAFFKGLWEKVKNVFSSFWEWMKGLGPRFYNAGANIVKSIWNGIKAFVNSPVEAIKNMVGKIRDYLPFSPAKVGPLKDLHRVRIIETIADTMKPQPMMKAMRRVAATTLIASSAMGGSAAPGKRSPGNAGGITITYAPVIHMGGGGSKEDFRAMLKTHQGELVKMIDEANRKNNRGKY